MKDYRYKYIYAERVRVFKMGSFCHKEDASRRF